MTTQQKWMYVWVGFPLCTILLWVMDRYSFTSQHRSFSDTAGRAAFYTLLFFLLALWKSHKQRTKA